MGASVVRIDGERTDVGDAEVEELRTGIHGSVLLPQDPANADVRGVFNAMHVAAPALTVRCTGTADVAQAVGFARERGLAVAVRGGGHSIGGLSTIDGGMLIDLSPMRGVVADPNRRLARAQGGALWADVDHETQAFGLATPGGVVSDTGIAGLTLGGGYGWLRRKHGLSCDNLLEAQVVGADGTVRTATAEDDPDLLWALRGGGGNFGVVTSFTYRLHPIGPMVAFAGCFHPIEDVAEVLDGWRSFVAEASDEVSSIVVTLTFPPDAPLPEPVQGRACAVVGAVYAGGVDEGMRALGPVGRIGKPLVNLTEPMPYTFCQSAFDALFARGTLRSYWKSQYLDELSDGAIGAFADAALTRPAPLTVVNLWHMGGAIAAAGAEESAFPERSAPFMVSIDGNWPDPSQDNEGIAWVRSNWDAMGRFGTGRSYLNFTGLSDEPPSTAVDTAYGPNLERLAKIKATHDPGNFFRRNNNIAPAP